MNLLVTGSGSSGSWIIRGEQLGRAIGATVIPKALDVAAFDAAICIKRPPADLVDRIHRAKIPLIWDVVDAWPQPVGNAWNRDECLAWLRERVQAIRPTAIVAATRAMADDCAEFGLPVLALPHHARPGLTRTVIRPMRRVGYEGAKSHLGSWREWLEAETQARGWEFVMNPTVEVDVLVAFREVTGYAPRRWKSNVKLANAQGSGTPVICAREAGYIETQGNGVIFADTHEEVRWALDTVQSTKIRARLADDLFAGTPRLEAIAAIYKAWLGGLECLKAQNS